MATIAQAMELIINEAIEDSPLKRERALKKLRKSAKVPGWEDSMRRTMTDEWWWRVCCAKLCLNDFSWEGWGYREPRDGYIPFNFPWWEGQKVESLLIMSEQGLGDEILFASCLNEIPCDNITVECDPRLVNVFTRSFPHIEFIGRKEIVKGHWITDNSWADGRQWEAQALMGELPTWYRRKPEDFPGTPYLIADPDLSYSGLVGASWVGRQGGVDPAIIDADISLQYGVDTHPFAKPNIDLREDIDALFSIIAALDRVVSVPTTVVHIAGSLGIPCDVILPQKGKNHGGFSPDINNALNWRWRKNKRNFLWHNSVKVYERSEWLLLARQRSALSSRSIQ